MEPTEIKSGPADIIASGTVIAFNGNPVEIIYGPQTERLKVIFVFIDEPGKTELNMEAEAIDLHTLKLTLRNFVSPFGAGNIKPIAVGTLNDRTLYLQYRIYPLLNGDKTIHFTIYVAELAAKA